MKSRNAVSAGVALLFVALLVVAEATPQADTAAGASAVGVGKLANDATGKCTTRC